MLLLCALIVGTSVAWGTDYSTVLTLNCASASSSGNTAKYGASNTSMTSACTALFLNDAASVSSKISVSTAPTSTYWTKGSGGTGIPDNCLKVGTASGAGSFSFTIDNSYETIDRVIVTGYGWKATSKIAINGSSTQSPTYAATETDFTFDLASSSRTITVNVTTSAVCITNIVLQKIATPAYTITATRNNNDYGTVSVSGSTITASPSNGYRVIAGSDGYTVTSGTANVTNNGDNTFSVSPISDCTVQINFEVIPTHTATFSVNGETTSTSFAEGASIVFPSNPAAIQGKSFVGWSESTISGTTDSEPSFVTSATMGVSDVTFYAVFATASDTRISATFDASDITNTPATENDLEWEHTASGITLKLSAGQRYTSGTTDTWTITSGTSNYFQVTADRNLTSVVTTITSSTYKINSVESGASVAISGTTQTVTFSSDKTSVKCYATSSNQIRATTIVVNAGELTYNKYCTTVSNLPIPTIVTECDGGEETEMSIIETGSGEIMFEVDEDDYTGTLGFSVDDGTIISLNTSNVGSGSLIVNGLKEGTAVVTITAPAVAGKYQATSKDITVTVLPVVNLGMNPIVIDSWNSLSYGDESDYTVGGITFKATQCMLSSSCLQMKASYGILKSPVVVSNYGYTVTIKTSAGSNNSGTLTVQIGNETAQTVTGKNKTLSVSTTSTSSAFSIKNLSGNMMQVEEITITPAPYVEVGEAGYATYVTNDNVSFPVGVTAYIATSVSTNTIHLTEVTSAPAGTALVIKAVEGIYQLSVEDAGDCDNVDANLLQWYATSTTPEANYDYYVLTKDNEGVCFAQYTSTTQDIPAYKAFIKTAHSEAPAMRFAFDEENNATNINAIEANEKVMKLIENGQILIKREGIVYDALGRKIR